MLLVLIKSMESSMIIHSKQLKHFYLICYLQLIITQNTNDTAHEHFHVYSGYLAAA